MYNDRVFQDPIQTIDSQKPEPAPARMNPTSDALLNPFSDAPKK